MSSFVLSLFSACVGGLIVWYAVMRRGVGAGATASTTAEIERLRKVVEELTAALEQKAEAAEQRLNKAVAEANAVQSILDRALTSVGAQITRPQAVAGENASPRPASIETAPPAPPSPSAAQPEQAMPIQSTAGIRSMTPEPVSAPPDSFSSVDDARGIARISDDHGRIPSADSADMLSTAAQSAFIPTSLPILDAAPETPADASAIPLADSTDLSAPTGERDATEAAEREARVMSLVARGMTNSVEIARQTGLTRGEVELILTLHNLHIAPGSRTVAEPARATPAPEAAAARKVSPDDIVVNPDDRYAAIYALIAAGVTDSVEIARRTGLGRGEVELHMGLHARNVL